MAENSETQRKNSQPKRGGAGKPFAPGQSGNPGGRPKGFAALVREQTLEGVPLVGFALKVHAGEAGINLEGATVREQIEAARLRLDAGKWLAERGWGAPQQQIEHGGADGAPLQIIVTTYKGAS